MPTTQRNSLTDRLLRYSATASLLTAGMLVTSSSPALAGGIVTNVYGAEGDLMPGDSLSIDIDDGGSNEFSIIVGTDYILGSLRTLYFAFIGDGGADYHPFALNHGYSITAGAQWKNDSAGFMTISAFSNLGHWTDSNGTQPHYLGVRFLDDSTSLWRYGWVEMTVTSLKHGGPHVIVHRTGMDNPAGTGVPATVGMASVQAASGLQTVAAGAFAALGGALTWLRNKLRK